MSQIRASFLSDHCIIQMSSPSTESEILSNWIVSKSSVRPSVEAHPAAAVAVVRQHPRRGHIRRRHHRHLRVSPRQRRAEITKRQRVNWGFLLRQSRVL